jgi:hemerythrin-like domain-containing protein
MDESSRRDFIRNAGLLGAAAVLTPAALSGCAEERGKEVEVSPLEDLMREHGVLRRLMLIYDEIGLRLAGGRDFPPETLTRAAGIIRRFIQDYHEKLEEDHLFHRFEAAGKLVDLVKVLRLQHEAGRRVIDAVQAQAASGAFKSPPDRTRLAEHLALFTRMYRPHAAREDTVLFPAFRALVSPKIYETLGDKFEDNEQELFGKEGFEKIVAQVADLEGAVDIGDLSRFTPKV